MPSQSNETWTSEYVRSEGAVQQIQERPSKGEKINRKSIVHSPTQKAVSFSLHVAGIEPRLPDITWIHTPRKNRTAFLVPTFTKLTSQKNCKNYRQQKGRV